MYNYEFITPSVKITFQAVNDQVALAVLCMIMPLVLGMQWAVMSINERWVASILTIMCNMFIVIRIYHAMPSKGVKPDIRKEDIEAVIDILKEWSDGFQKQK